MAAVITGASFTAVKLIVLLVTKLMVLLLPPILLSPASVTVIEITRLGVTVGLCVVLL